MKIEAIKLNFIEEYLRLTNDAIVKKLAMVLKEEKKKVLSAQLKPMTKQTLSEKIMRSEEDIANGRVYAQSDVERHFKNRLKK